jgi:hypothetical protein
VIIDILLVSYGCNAALILCSLAIRIQKLRRCMHRHFPHFGMRLSRACVKRTISATGALENSDSLLSYIMTSLFQCLAQISFQGNGPAYDAK